jgi:putative PEP-CTERM system TPR-repeat lipoprotein
MTLLISSCSKLTTEEYISQAQSKYQNNEPLSAVVLLKSAISNDVANAQARLLLGKVYVSLGRVSFAEKELSTALKLGANPNEVVPFLAKSLSMQSKNAEVSDLAIEFTNLSSEPNATLRFYHTLGLFKQGYSVKAKKNIGLIEENSTNKYDLLSQNFIMSVNEDLDKAIDNTEVLIRQHETFDDAYLFLGKLLLQEKDFLKAGQVFSSYVAMQPEYLAGHFFLADALVNNGQYDDARGPLSLLLATNEGQPYINQLLSLVEYESKNYELAFFHSNKAIDNGLSNYISNLVAGLSSFHLKNLEQSYQYFKRIQDEIPSNHFARSVFMSLQMELGYIDDAAEYTKELGQSDMVDSGILTSLGLNLLQTGEKEKALEVFGLIKHTEVQNPSVLTKMGLFKQLVGDDSSIEVLEKSLALDDTQALTKIAFINDLMIQGKQVEAIDFAKKWISEEPLNIIPFNLVTSILIKQERLEAAEEFLSGALKINETNPLSLIYFANKEMVGGNSEESLSIIKKLINGNPDYVRGWYSYYLLANTSKSKAEFISLLSDYSDKQKNDELDTFYSQVLLEQGDFKKAKVKLQRIVENGNPSQLSYELYGRTLEQLDKIDKSISVYSNWRSEYPKNIRPWLFELVLHEKSNSYYAGLKLLDEAKKLFPNEIRFDILTAQFEILSGNTEQTDKFLTKWQGDVRFKAVSELLQAQKHLQNKQYSQALPGFKNFYALRPIGKNALIIYEIYKKLDRVSEGQTFLESRLTNFPEDKAVKAKLALEYLDDNTEKSIAYFLALINDEPNNIHFLNNVSWAYHKMNKNEDALPLIERAHKVDSKNISVIDSYVRILVDLGRLDKASEIINITLKESPKNPNLVDLQALIFSRQ